MKNLKVIRCADPIKAKSESSFQKKDEENFSDSNLSLHDIILRFLRIEV
jgi:hypothetical protein